MKATFGETILAIVKNSIKFRQSIEMKNIPNWKFFDKTLLYLLKIRIIAQTASAADEGIERKVDIPVEKCMIYSLIICRLPDDPALIARKATTAANQ